MKRVSLKDIAEKAGVSTATVSLVLNGKEKEGRIGIEVTEKIRRIAKEMNYSPNNLARGLRIGRSNTISLIVADISNYFFANLAFQVQEHAEKYGYTVIMANTNESSEKMGRMISAMRSRQVDGFIIVPTEEGESYIEELKESNTPFVLLDRYFPSIPCSHVVVNNYHAAFEGTKILIGSGCKRIALLIYGANLQHMKDRMRGYEDALKRAGLYQPNLIKFISHENIAADVRNAIKELREEKEKVDGVFFATNNISLLGIKQLLESGIKIPNEVKVLCFDKNEAFDFSGLSLSYIQQPIPEMGKMCVDLLIEQMKGARTTPVNIELYASLNEGS